MRLSYWFLICTLLYYYNRRNLGVSSQIVYGSKSQYNPLSESDSLNSCVPSLSVAFIVDSTESMMDSINYVKENILNTIHRIQQNYPSSEFSISTFTDKPISPLGFNLPTWEDYCIQIESTFEDSMVKHTQVINLLNPGGGQDFYESQIDSLYRAALMPQLKWKKNPITPEGTPYVKILVMVTDAYYHKAGDTITAANRIPALTNTVGANTLTKNLLDADPNNLCKRMDYPTIPQLAQVIKENKYLPIFITSPAHFICKTGLCPYPELKITARELNNPLYADPYKGINLMYNNLLKDMDVTGFVQSVSDDSISFSDAFYTKLNTLLDFNSHCSTTTSIGSTTTSIGSTTEESSKPCVDENNCPCKECGADVNINVNITIG